MSSADDAIRSTGDDATMNMSVTIDASSRGGPADSPILVAVTDAGNPLISPTFGASSVSSHDYTSAGEGLSESHHHRGFGRASAAAVGRTGSLRGNDKAKSAALPAGEGSNRPESGGLLSTDPSAGYSNGITNNGAGPSSAASSSSHRHTTGLGIVGPSPAAISLGLNADDGHFKPLYDGSTVDAREFVRLTLQSLRDLGME